MIRPWDVMPIMERYRASTTFRLWTITTATGKTEGVQTEIKGLLARLAAVLPKDASAGAVASDSASLAGKPNYLRAVYDYYFVVNDGG